MNTLWVTRMNIRELLRAFEKAVEQRVQTGMCIGPCEAINNYKRVELIRTEILHRFGQ